MDPRRMDTLAAMTGGIFGKPIPTTSIPNDREDVRGAGDDWSYIGNEAVIAALEAGKLVSASNYYGIPHVWKATDGVYRGTLLQYRSVTDDPTFATAREAAEWFEATYHATDD